LLNHCGGETPCLCCPASPHRARCLHRIPARLPRFVPCRVGAIVNRCKRTLIPIVQQRDALGSTLTKLYDQIGLDPTKPTIPTLASTWRLRRKHCLTDEYY